MKQLCRVVFLLIFISPGIIWYRQTGDLSIYGKGYAPRGQFIYVLSKLIGMYALTTLALQIVCTLALKLKLLDANLVKNRHHQIGAIVVSLSLLHFLLFTTAVSIRQGYPAFSLFLPDFSDYYHTHLSLGLIALWLLFTVAVTGVIRRKSSGKLPRVVHKVYWVSICLIYFHAMAIGSESQSTAGLSFYGLLGLICAIMFACWIETNKNSVIEMPR